MTTIKPRKKRRLVDPILQHEVAALRNVVSGEWRTFFDLLLLTGIRTSEALALTGNDLWELEGRRGIHVLRLKAKVDVEPAKIEIPDATLMAQLDALARDADRRARGVRRRRTLFSFGRVAVWKALKRFCALAGIRRLSPHQFRHTFAREHARYPFLDVSGRPISALDHRILLAQALGHSSERWVAIYFQPHGDELMQQTAQVGAVFKDWN